MSQKLKSERFTESSESHEAAVPVDGSGTIVASESKSQAAGASSRRTKVFRFQLSAAFPLALFIAVGGCTQVEPAQFVSNTEVEKLPAPLRTEVQRILASYCGTAREPRMLGDDSISVDRLERGRAVYLKRCESCHGVSGDGQGPAALTLVPKPRDYRKGVFKFIATKYGARPRLDDLRRTVKRGIPGTSMPSFNLLPKDDVEAVIDYVKLLAMRGEFESSLAREAPDVWDEVNEPDEGRTKVDAATRFQKAFGPILRESRDGVVKRWESADGLVVSPLTPEPVLTEARVTRGRETFLNPATGCIKCHGPDGRGQTIDNLRGDLKDAWGHPTQAADLTSGMLRGGDQPIDVYRRIYNGINGTPMPGFATIFAKEPDQIWDVVAFVLYVSNERRRGSIPQAAIGPMPGIRKDAPSTTASKEAHP